MNNSWKYGIICFSGTGNTEYVARQLQAHLQNSGNECGFLLVDRFWAECGRRPGAAPDRQIASQKLRDYLKNIATLVFCYPVYASALPKPAEELLEIMPRGNPTDLAVVTTMFMAGGDCCLLPAKKLRDKNYRPVLAANIKMPNNIKVPVFNFLKILNGEALKKFYDSSAKSIAMVADSLLSGRKHIEGRGILSLAVGFIQRKGVKVMEKKFIDSLYADDTCQKCGLCVKTCPMGNITREDSQPRFGVNCCFCLRCYNFCPVTAIQFTAGTKDKVKFTRYKGFDGWKPPLLYKSE